MLNEKEETVYTLPVEDSEKCGVENKLINTHPSLCALSVFFFFISEEAVKGQLEK